MNKAAHWNEVYATRPADQVGWFTPHLDTSLSWIRELDLDPNAAIIDVGGGASTLVDDLLEKGHTDITVLDLSERALRVAQTRLGSRADRVKWVPGDVTETRLPDRQYRLWHDRAVFHFLTQAEEQRKYRDALLKALRPHGFAIVGTFAPDAPPQCSGLPVQRYSAATLTEFFGHQFALKRHRYEPHITPSGLEQSYLYCLYQKVTGPGAAGAGKAAKNTAARGR